MPPLELLGSFAESYVLQGGHSSPCCGHEQIHFAETCGVWVSLLGGAEFHFLLWWIYGSAEFGGWSSKMDLHSSTEYGRVWQLILETVTPPLSLFPHSSLPFTTSSLPFLPLIMDSFVPALRASLESVCKEMEPKYPGITVEFLAKYFHDSLHVSSHPVVSSPLPVPAPVVAAPVAAAAEAAAPAADAAKDSRKRVVSKKMTESFMELAKKAGLSDDAAKTKFEEVKKAYKTATDAQLESTGGHFEAYAATFLSAGPANAAVGAGAPAPAPAPKQTKAKKEKKESRIAKWTPTLTRTLTKLVEENGGMMTDDIKTSFHAFVDGLDEETFKSLTLEAHMRRFIADRHTPSNAAGGSSNAAAVPLPPSPPEEEEEDEDLEDITVDDEKLLIGVKSGKLYRPTPAGDVWVGNAGIGRFSAVKVPSA